MGRDVDVMVEYAPAVVEAVAPVWTLAPGTQEEGLRRLWYRMRDEWLQSAEERSGSLHTRRAYEVASNLWLDFLTEHGLEPWEVTAATVRSWQAYLSACGLADSSVNARLSAVSSWYSFVIREVHLVDGVERSAFFDATGAPRQNPFKVGNVRRPKVAQYGKAHPLSEESLRRLFGLLEERAGTLTGSRNYALLMTYFLTASRNSEVVRLRWGDIRPSRSQPGGMVFAWRGKGGKEEDSALPRRAYEAITAHLRIAGRLVPGHEADIDDGEFVWVPLVSHGTANLRSAAGRDRERGHISEKNAVRILRTSLRLAGVKDAQRYRIHDLRHSFAHLYEGDLEKLRRILHHESLATTGIYKRSLADPVDDYSEGVWEKVGLF